MKKKNILIPGLVILMLLAVLAACAPARIHSGSSAKEIDLNVDASLDRFTRDVKGASEFLASAKGVLIIPKVIQGGFFVGGQYGEGALRIGGKTIDYYSLAGGSFGYQIGAQQKDIMLVFMEEEALNKFRASTGWQAGVDGTVAMANIGIEGSIDTTKIKDPIVGFVFGQKGLMAGVSISGSKFTKLTR
ncbi:BPSL1445 family SYLF domain-containing lipoprotein [Syntrophus aciditrophicus]|uniref:Hypothetical exported protein n=1 Tax=Syntrophus aciditrophicus (strain SB) TaxID=56780 RepID=Q2LX71_SYNAS|nr:YSC84-related protein [Syntrophus aciditrophicus]ABC78681.1 hypothetical exported protein [Syntrophus aciditrophicus SB]OPY16361.1 MAG: hypothetical protein A4E74_01878 [Syntrophus sp. PtaB.Bin075]